jgi:hypothetical protein
MPRTVNARVTRTDGTTFEARVANLTVASALLVTDEPLAFRDHLVISIFGVTIESEVALAISDPRLGAVVAFAAPENIRDVLAAYAADIEVLTLAFEPPTEQDQWGDPTTAASPIVARLESSTEPLQPERPTVRTSRPRIAPDSLDQETFDELHMDIDTLVHSEIPLEPAIDTPTPQNMPVMHGVRARPPLKK